MADTNFLKSQENRVFLIQSENFKSMMLAPDGMLLLGKRVETPESFKEKYDQGGTLSWKGKIEAGKFKNFTAKMGQAQVDIGYKKLLELGAPGHLTFDSPEQLADVLAYIEQAWYFQRTEKRLSPIKAALPNLGLLLATLVTMVYVLYVNTFGGTFKVNLAALAAIKIGGWLGPFGTLALGLLISVLIARALWKSFKNPPVEIRLEPAIS